MCRNIGDIEDIPKTHNFVLGIASVWMLFPVTYGVFSVQSTAEVSLLLTLMMSCCASLVLWSDPKSNSTKHKIDQAAAVLFFIAVAMNADISWFWGWFSCTMLLYACSYMAFHRQMFRLQLCAHLVFRFSAYWAAHWVLVPVRTSDSETNYAYLLLTCAHFLHVVLLYRMAFRHSIYLQFPRAQKTRNTYWRAVYLSACAVLSVVLLYETMLLSLIPRTAMRPELLDSSTLYTLESDVLFSIPM